MRVIAGLAKGHPLKGPKSDAIRPVIDKVKGAIFNILGPVDGLAVLDLFAGTGAVGIEALSRGAATAVFVEGGDEGGRLIRANLLKTKLQGRLVRARLPQGLKRLQRDAPFDLIFIDPPYEKGLVTPTLRAVIALGLLAPAGRIVIEHAPREIPELTDLPLTLLSERAYGQTRVTFLSA